MPKMLFCALTNSQIKPSRMQRDYLKPNVLKQLSTR
jgi:hypothetical protein